MQLRETGNKIQVLRAEYVPAERDENGNLKRGTGRTKTKMVGSFDSYLSSVSLIDSSLLEKLSDDEKQIIADYIEEKKQSEFQGRLKSAPRWAAEYIKMLADNYDPAVISDDQLTAIREAVKTLNAARAEYKRKHKEQA